MRLIILILFVSIFFLSCKNEIKRAINSSETTINTDSSANQASFKKYPAWITEVQILRQALYQKDLKTLHRFFNYPLQAQQSEGLVTAFTNFKNDGKDYSKLSIKTDHDIEMYFDGLFPAYYIKGLLPIKSDSLFINKMHTSENFKYNNDGVDYSSSISFDEAENVVSVYFNSAYTTDGEDEYSGESATIYRFKLNENNQLKFVNVLFAG